MAKMIKCPTCGTPIEVPANADGQVVKCPGCGKGLKLVARKRSPASTGAHAAGAGNSVAGNSVTGTSVSGITLGAGEAPSNRAGSYSPDDLPNLDAMCAVCGRSTDPDDLVEDNGKLVCPDCIKGARSKIDRPEGGADLVDFKPAAYVPTKRTKLVHITPSLIAVVAIGLVYLGCSFYLNLFPKPVGTATASLSEPKPRLVLPPIVTQDNNNDSTAHETPTHEPSEQPAQTGTTKPIAVADTDSGNAHSPATQASAPSPETSQPAPETLATANTPPKTGSVLFGDPNAPDTKPAQPGPAPIVSTDPLEQGMQALMAGKYDQAKRAMELARSKYLPVGLARDSITGQQSQVLEGLAAADIGLHQADDAKSLLMQVYRRTPESSRSRALLVNRVIAMLDTPTPSTEFGVAIEDLQRYLQSKPDDEYAADVFGMALEKAKTFPNVTKENLAAMWKFLDGYDDRLAQSPDNQQAHPNQLKWGTEWLPAEDVQHYRAARGQGDGVSLTQAARDLEAARSKNKIAQDGLAHAKEMQTAGRHFDLVGFQNNADAAAANLAAAQKTFQIATAGLHPAKWLSHDQLQPVLPEMQAPDSPK
jgi:hypothetical protein